MRGWLAVGLFLAACSGSGKDEAPPAKEKPAVRVERAPVRPAAPVEADEATVQRLCANCHGPVEPKTLNKNDWDLAIGHIHRIIVKRTGKAYTPGQIQSLLAYYQNRSPDRLPALEPVPADSPVQFEAAVFGRPAERIGDAKEPGPRIVHVNATDLDRKGGADVLVSEETTGQLSWVHRQGKAWREDVLAMVGTPGRTRVYDHDGDRDLDIAVAVLGSIMPTEQLVGGVMLLSNEGTKGFSARVVAAGLPRVNDIGPGDLDGDGDIDFAVAAFGFIDVGEVGWLEQTRRGEYTYHTLQKTPGALYVPVLDLDGDGDLDVVTLLSQEHESVVAFLNDGKGSFEPRTLWAAGSPTFGSSGLEVADLDGDGDDDLVFTNGDAFDVPGYGPRPYHGVHWLENRGKLQFQHHEVGALYGTYGSAIGDLDGDGDLDIAAVSMFNVWSDPRRHSVVWFENDGKQQFKPHGIGTAPIHQVTVDIADLDGDGRADIVTGGLHKLSPPRERMGRVTVWWNRGAP